MAKDWIQIRGDPSIREFLFHQERRNNQFDQDLVGVLEKVETLLCLYGIFHAKIHFSSGQVTLWLIDDPMRYRVFVGDEFLNLNFERDFTLHDYSSEAIIRSEQVNAILQGFNILRTKDPQIYLRSGSINVINGIVGLNFSCDGSHYLGYNDFLDELDTFF